MGEAHRPGGGLPPELDPRGRHRREPGAVGDVLPVPPSRRRRGAVAARVLSWVAVLTSLAVLVASGTAWVAFQRFSGSLERIDVFDSSDPERPQAASRAEAFLLVGSDSREGFTEEELQAANTTFEEGRRSDTTILVHVPAGSDRALLVSIPRDAFVQIPAHTDPETGERLPARSDKFNEAYARGGPALTVKTVERMSGIRIDHYVEVDFTGFQRMVDALGGVDVCVPRPARDPLAGLDLPAGTSRVEGEQALAFVRARHVFGGTDIDRIGRQQQFLGAMLDRATSTGVLLRPDRLLQFLDVVSDSVTTDEEFGFGEMRTLATRMRDLDPARVTFTTLPFSDLDYTPEGYRGSYVRVDAEAARELFRRIRTDTYFDEAPATPPAPAVDPATVSVQVLNAAGTPGLGRQASEELAGLGFAVGTPGNAERTGVSATTVRHPRGQADAAAAVAAALPGATVTEDRSLPGETVLVEVGTSYDGVAPAAPAAAGEPAAADPGLGVNPRTAADDPCATAPGA